MTSQVIAEGMEGGEEVGRSLGDAAEQEGAGEEKAALEAVQALQELQACERGGERRVERGAEERAVRTEECVGGGVALADEAKDGGGGEEPEPGQQRHRRGGQQGLGQVRVILGVMV